MLLPLQTLVVLLLLLCLLLLIQYRRILNEFKRIARTTEGIRAGNFNLRYRMRMWNGPVRDAGGELNRLVGHVQTSLDRTQFLEDERKRMIASISHDLRTPLTSLLGYMEALRSDPSLTDEERREFVRIAADKGNALLERLQEFFELARLEADDSEIELRRVDIGDILQEVLVGFYPEFQKAAITPTVRLPDAPLAVTGDRAYLRRIFENLIGNALRYGRDGREIGIAVREEPDLLWIDVWDRGQGISSQDLPRVFERFYTGEASRNAALRGSGLGLTITKHLVEQQGGRIAAASKPGEKTVFSVGLVKG